MARMAEQSHRQLCHQSPCRKEAERIRVHIWTTRVIFSLRSSRGAIRQKCSTASNPASGSADSTLFLRRRGEVRLSRKRPQTVRLRNRPYRGDALLEGRLGERAQGGK